MIQRLFEYARAFPSDINEHMDALMTIASDCEHITEMGIRDMISTWAFLEGLRRHGEGKLISIDLILPKGISVDVVAKNAKNEKVNFQFIVGDSHKIEIEETDFLFIDTIHTKEHLRKELKLHAGKVRKYIAFHDTESCANELVPVIDEFLLNYKDWKRLVTYYNNNGMSILKHV